MTYTTRRILGLAVVATLGALIGIYEPHRHFLAWAWPYFVDFWSTFIAF
jgi:hypothetical protein